MRVTILIATYRRDEALRRALASAVGQTWQDLEVLVVDDNADAEWNEKTAAITAEFPAVRYLRNETNLGSAETRNAGIREATGEYVTFLDDDDEYLPGKVERQVKAMESAGADYSVTDLELYHDDGTHAETRGRGCLEGLTDPAVLMRRHFMFHITGTDTMMLRRDYLLKIGGFAPINVGDEFYLMERAIDGGGRFCYLPGSDIRAYVHDEGKGISTGASKIDGENALYRYKKTKFKRFDGACRRYIRMRHHAVLAFCYLRKKAFFRFFCEGVASFFCAPIACVRLLTRYKRCGTLTAEE